MSGRSLQPSEESFFHLMTPQVAEGCHYMFKTLQESETALTSQYKTLVLSFLSFSRFSKCKSVSDIHPQHTVLSFYLVNTKFGALPMLQECPSCYTKVNNYICNRFFFSLFYFEHFPNINCFVSHQRLQMLGCLWVQ